MESSTAAKKQSTQSTNGKPDNGQAVSPICAEDIVQIRQPMECSIAPDGSYLVLTLQYTNHGAKGNHSNLYLMPLKDELKPDGISAELIGSQQLRQLTFGDHEDSEAKFSPDSSLIAFKSNRSGSTQVHIIPVDGGSERQFTNYDGTVYGFDWSPDSRCLVVAMQPPDERTQWMEKNDKAEVDWRWVDNLEFKVNAAGVAQETKVELHIFDLLSRESRVLHSDGKDNDSPVFTPDGRSIVFVSNKADDPEYDFLEEHVWSMPVKGGQPKQLDQGIPGCASEPSVSPDGRLVAFRWRPPTNSRLGWHTTRLYVVPIEGGEPRQLGAELDRPADIAVHNDTWSSPEMAPPLWSPDSSTLYSVITSEGEAHPYAFDVASGKATKLFHQEGVTIQYGIDHVTQQIYYTFGMLDSPGELFVRGLSDGSAPRQLTDFNPWLRERSVTTPITTWAQADGYRVHGWVLLPPDFDKSLRYPAVHYIHGGPHSSYPNAYMHQFQLLAARGYIVFYANITGSTGYGEEFKLPLKERWGGRDWDDVQIFLDHVLREFPAIDPQRVAIAGGSYGGYMVNWALGHTDRYACAISERGVSEMISHQGDGDTALIHTGFDLPMDEHAFKNFEMFWNMSPLKYIHKAQTPTLIICAEDDLRVPSVQMDNLYTALKLQKCEVRMLRFPEADHTFYTDGAVKQRIYWMNAITDWLDQHLQIDQPKPEELKVQSANG